MVELKAFIIFLEGWIAILQKFDPNSTLLAELKKILDLLLSILPDNEKLLLGKKS
jgi:hypothetical protein